MHAAHVLHALRPQAVPRTKYTDESAAPMELAFLRLCFSSTLAHHGHEHDDDRAICHLLLPVSEPGYSIPGSETRAPYEPIAPSLHRHLAAPDCISTERSSNENGKTDVRMQ